MNIRFHKYFFLPMPSTLFSLLSVIRCCVVSKLNDGVGVMFGHAVMGEQGVQGGTKHAPLRGHSVEDQQTCCKIGSVSNTCSPHCIFPYIDTPYVF